MLKQVQHDGKGLIFQDGEVYFTISKKPQSTFGESQKNQIKNGQ
ncbi:MAG: hypothetical protein AB8G11_19620 [Saprospiraceae bacterium]